MKGIIFSLALVLMGMSVGAQPTVGGANIEMNTINHDFGVMNKGGDASFTFIAKNTGDQPLLIERCQASCGCTVPNWDTNPIAPGASTEIKVKYDSNRIGPFSKTITVFSNAATNPQLVLTIKGEIKE